MTNQNNCNYREQSQGNIRSSKKKNKGKIWSEEEMAEAEPYPLPELKGNQKKNKQESEKDSKEK